MGIYTKNNFIKLIYSLFNEFLLTNIIFTQKIKKGCNHFIYLKKLLELTKGQNKMIQEYIKNNKKCYKVRNHYIGINPYTGEEIRINKAGLSSKKEAELLIAREKVALENGNVYLNNQKITLEELYKMFIEQHQHNVKGGTILHSGITFKRINKIKDIEINKLTLPILQNLINELSKKYARKTISITRVLLSQLLDYAVKLNYLDKNIAKHLTIPRYEIEKVNPQEKFYTKEELKEFLQIVKNNYDLETLVIFRLLAYTGARKGEIGALTWQDIDFKNCTVDINKTCTVDKDNNFCISSTKTRTSTRIISIDNDTIELLRRYRLQSTIFNINSNILDYKNHTFNTKLTTIYKDFPHLKKITVHGTIKRLSVHFRYFLN